MEQGNRSDEVWVLGATGRTGRAVAARLAADGVPPVLVGRNRERLRQVGATLGLAEEPKVVVAGTPGAIAAEVSRQRPAVVVNSLGDYARSAPAIVRACLPGGHYVDLAADLPALLRLAELHQEAQDGGSTLVTGAGFGVMGTQAVVAKLGEGRPAPSRVHVDAIPSVTGEAGPMGEALAASIVDLLTTGGRRYVGGRLARRRLGSDTYPLTLPDGDTVTSVSVPSGELYAAQAVSGAPDVDFASTLVPPGRAVRALLPVVGALLGIPALRRLALSRLARVEGEARPRPREHTWGHAVVTWSDGTVREGWLRAGDAMDFTAAVAAGVAEHLARGEGKPGAWTPAAAFGPELAVEAGATFVLDR